MALLPNLAVLGAGHEPPTLPLLFRKHGRKCVAAIRGAVCAAHTHLQLMPLARARHAHQRQPLTSGQRCIDAVLTAAEDYKKLCASTSHKHTHTLSLSLPPSLNTLSLSFPSLTRRLSTQPREDASPLLSAAVRRATDAPSSSGRHVKPCCTITACCCAVSKCGSWLNDD